MRPNRRGAAVELYISGKMINIKFKFVLFLKCRMKFHQTVSLTFNGAGVRVFTAPVYQNQNNQTFKKGGKVSKRRCYKCARYGHIARQCLAPRKPKGNADKELVSLPPSPPQVDQMEVIQEEAVVVEESPKVGVNVEQLAGMVSNVDVSNDDSQPSSYDEC
ncbi:uncharacterized protein LOC103311493 [Acyrthosiphon pisum]|uniref:CCHC-type domain-containing protein n=1 Tax=Acyrthosiphon pisum TaxID=7029 RepID=A0A8R2H840_ACYPI|nr:uncharacterized protein LOC103311493 [Acyrthosiphon pisum]